jgi:hypothetical protein
VEGTKVGPINEMDFIANLSTSFSTRIDSEIATYAIRSSERKTSSRYS